jgi:voltage-gated potassium channel
MFFNEAKNRFLVLLIGILCLIFFSPILSSTTNILPILDIFFSILLLSCVFAVSNNKRYAMICTAFGLPFLALIWLSHLFIIPKPLGFIGHLSGIIFIGNIIYAILKHVLNQKYVGLEVIYGAIVAYLLFGILCTLGYGFIDLLQPDSFGFSNELVQDSRLRFLYFSYVTLTTLGYGDITPITAAARSLATLEAIVGQIYLVVLVAWLVGMHVSQSMDEKDSEKENV